ncbi:leucine-rich repeat domain-containing protein [bacterium]|nr:leucine-rich repeat domain-containing protein [bacterium]
MFRISFDSIAESAQFVYEPQDVIDERVSGDMESFADSLSRKERRAAYARKALRQVHAEDVKPECRFAAEEERKFAEFKKRQRIRCFELAKLKELNRHDFSLKRNRRIADIQNNIAADAYRFRLAASKRRFEHWKKQPENKALLEKWPMSLPPEAVRREHMSGGCLTFGVFLLKSRHNQSSELEQVWNTEVYPLIEDGLKHWIDSCYHGRPEIDNIKLYGGSADCESMSSESVKDMLRSFFNGLPTLILETELLSDEIRLAVTAWGLGGDSLNKNYSAALCSGPLGEALKEGQADERRRLAGEVSSCFKTAVGCCFDAFRLAEYNQMPVFPEIVKTDADLADYFDTCLRSELGKTVRSEAAAPENSLTELYDRSVGVFYRKLYSLFIAPDSRFSADYPSNKSVNAYALRLGYAEKTAAVLSPCRICRMLKDSIEAWCSLRGEYAPQKYDVFKRAVQAFVQTAFSRFLADGKSDIDTGGPNDGFYDWRCSLNDGLQAEDWLEKFIVGGYPGYRYFSADDEEYIDGLVYLLSEMNSLKSGQTAAAWPVCGNYLRFLCEETKLLLSYGFWFMKWQQKEFSVFAGNPAALAAVKAYEERAYAENEVCRAVFIPENVGSVGYGAFEDCGNLRLLKMYRSAEEVGGRAFAGCGSLKYALLSPNIAAIGEYAFADCGSLKEIKFPEGVRSIGEYAFYGCEKLTEVVLPDSLEEIGRCAFAGCPSIEMVIFKGRVYTDCLSFNRELMNLGISEYFHVWSRGTAEELFAANAGIRGAYEGYPVLKVRIPLGVLAVREYAFSECAELQDVYIPDSVVAIGRGAFWRCSRLTRIVMSDGIKIVAKQAFEGCESLNEIVFKGRIYRSVDAFLDAVLKDSRRLMSLVEALTAKKVVKPTARFKGFTNKDRGAESVIVPVDVTALDDSAFANCERLKRVRLPYGLTSIGEYAFYKCVSLTSVIIPEKVASIGEGAFASCSSLTSVSMSDGLTSIGAWAFDECSSLTSVSLPDGLTSIGDWAFHECSSLTSVSLPVGLTSIGESVFCGCTSLTGVNISDGVTSLAYSVFYCCSSLKDIKIPSGVKSIGDFAFYGCVSLKDVSIPYSVTSVGNYAFGECSELRCVCLPEGLVSINRSSFKNCSRLHKIIFRELYTAAEKSFIRPPKNWA